MAPHSTHPQKSLPAASPASLKSALSPVATESQALTLVRKNRHQGLAHNTTDLTVKNLTSTTSADKLTPSFAEQSPSPLKALLDKASLRPLTAMTTKTLRHWGLSPKTAASILLVSATVTTALFTGVYAQQWLSPSWDAELTSLPLSNGLTLSEMKQRSAQFVNPEGEAINSKSKTDPLLPGFTAQPDGLPQELLDSISDHEPSEQAVKVLAAADVTVNKVTQEAKAAKEKKSVQAKLVQAAKNWVRPVASGRISSHFGWRHGRLHQGMDYAARIGTPIVAVKAGKVTYSGWQRGYGRIVVIKHDDGSKSKYAHCNTLAVRKGQWVGQGQRIATVGNTGRSTGPHLHFELIRGGIAVNPYSYVERSTRIAKGSSSSRNA